MELDIHIVEQGGMVCQDMAYATAAVALKREYQLMYLKAWEFDFSLEHTFLSKNPKEFALYDSYEPEKQKSICREYEQAIGKRVSAGNPDVELMLEAFHGVKVVQKSAEDENAYWNGILKQLDKKIPVDMWFDQYYMPWTKQMRKKAPLRYQGYMMINGYDPLTEQISCIDIHGTRQQESMPLSTFQEFLHQHQRFQYTTYEICNEGRFFDRNIFLTETLSRVYEKNECGYDMFAKMRGFAEYVRELFDLQREIALSHETKGEIAAPTHLLCSKGLIEVSRMRNLFAVTLDYIATHENNDSFHTMSKKFKLLATKWQVLVSMIGKAYFKHSYDGLSVQLAEHIEKIAQMEDALAGQFEELLQTTCDDAGEIVDCNSKKKRNGDDVRKEHSGTEVHRDCVGTSRTVTDVYLDLGADVNNKAFSPDNRNVWNADFDGLGNYLILDEQMKQERFDCAAGRFLLRTGQKEKDNICCNGQKITVEPAFYKEICILGACDSGAFYGQMQIQYEDGTSEDIILGFSEWRFGKCEFGDRSAWKGKRVYWNKISEEEMGYLFTTQISLHEARKVTGLKLPECENMHLFAVTLRKLDQDQTR